MFGKGTKRAAAVSVMAVLFLVSLVVSSVSSADPFLSLTMDAMLG